MQVALPAGWTQAQYEWLSALGQAKDPAPLLRQNREWQRAAWVQARLDALKGLSPAEVRRLLPAVRGLVVVADRVGDIDTRCYARENRRRVGCGDLHAEHRNPAPARRRY